MDGNGEIISELTISPDEMPPLFIVLDRYDTAQKNYFGALASLSIKRSADNIEAVNEGCVSVIEAFEVSVMAISDSEPDLRKRAAQLATLIIKEQKDRNYVFNLLFDCAEDVAIDEQWRPLSEELYDAMLDIDDDQLSTMTVTQGIIEASIERQVEDLDHFMTHTPSSPIDRAKRLAGLLGRQAFGAGQIVAAIAMLPRR